MSKRDRSVIADLEPYRRPGQKKWRVRGWVPIRQPDGSIARRRIERSVGSDRKSEAVSLCERLALHYQERALHVARPLTFARAVTNYLAAGGEARFLTAKLLLAIGVMQCADIDDSVMADLAGALYPGRSPAYVNRALYTPVISVLRMAAKGKHCAVPNLTRPKMKKVPVQIPPDDWLETLLPCTRPKLRALLLLMTLHGLRITEAIGRTPDDLDIAAGVLSIPNTKTGEAVRLEVADVILEAIAAIPDWRSQRWLFGTCVRQNIYRDLAKACERAGVPYFRPHAAGRHTFASRLLRGGKSVKFAQDAGRWKTGRLVTDTYGHLAPSDVAHEVKRLADKTGRRLLGVDVVPIKKGQRRGD